MSNKPYVIQDGSPNLVIVPTETHYEPCAKKPKLDTSGFNKLQINKSVSAMVNKTSVKMSLGATTRNDNVLIDVSKLKKQQSSWASNFLQSIGGCVKPSRMYHSLGTKYVIPRKANAQTNASRLIINHETIKPKLSKEDTPPKANKETIHPKKDKEPIQLNLCKESTLPKTNPKAPQSNKKAYQPKAKTEITQPVFIREKSQTKGNTETSRPKDKKEPTYSRSNETIQTNISIEISQSKAKKEVTPRKSSKETILANAVEKTSHHKPNKDGTKLKNRREATQPNTTTKGSHVKANKEATQLNATAKVSQVKANKDAFQSKSKDTSRNTNKAILQLRRKKESAQSKPHTKTRHPNTIAGICQTKESNKKVCSLKTDKCKAIANNKCTDQLSYKDTNKAKTKKGTVQISPIKQPTTAAAILKREDIKLNLNMLRVVGKDPIESQNDSSNTKPKSLNEKSKSSTSPIKSVVTKINKKQTPQYQLHKESDYHVHHSQNQCDIEVDTDLRARLKRKLPKNEINYKDEQKRDHKNNNNTFCTVPNSKGFVPDENLIISFNAESDNKQTEKKPLIKTKTQKSGGKKCKKIKLQINILFQTTDTSDDEDLDNNCHGGSGDDFHENTDLSFLDDFNIDEIVESLNDCQSSKPKTKIDVNTNQHINEAENMRRDSSTIDGRQTDGCSTIQTSRDEFPSVEKILNQDSVMQLQNRGQKNCHETASITTNYSDFNIDIKNMPANKNEVKIKTGSVELSTDDSPSDVKNVCFNNEANTFISQSKSTQKEVKCLTSAKKNVVLNSNPSSNHEDRKTHQVKNTNQEDPTQNLTNDQPNYQCSNIDENNDIKNDQLQIDKNLKATELPVDIKNTQNNVEITIIDDSITKVKGQQHLKAITTMDLTNDLGILLDEKSDDIIFVEATSPNVIEIDTEPILILDTDYDVGMGMKLEYSSDEKENIISSNESHSNVAQLTNISKNLIETTNKLLNNSFSNSLSENNIENGLIVENNVIPSTKILQSKKTVELSTAVQSATETNTIETKDGIPKTTNVESQNARPSIQPKSPDNVAESKPDVVKRNETTQWPPNNSFVKDEFVKSLESNLENKYHITDIVHQGKFSTLYCCEHQNQSKKIIKVLRVEYDRYHLGLCKEDMLTRLQKGIPKENQKIVFFFKGFEMNMQWCFVMEYFPKNLGEALLINKECFHIDKVQQLSMQLVTAVTVLRNKNIIHSDIKPHHILLDESETRLKLGGFDDAFYFCNNNLLPNIGTVNYRAPELILGFYSDHKIDVWSTALVMYEMATNKQLFPGRFNNDILYKQMCTLGNMPYDMLQRSYFTGAHFSGTTFCRAVGPQGKGTIFIHNFMRSNTIHNTLFNAYGCQWAKSSKTKSVRQPAEDKDKVAEVKNKVAAFENLLYQMLVLHPRRRISIEFVFANPFIYRASR